MFAVIETGGKQYRVTPNLRLRVEKLPADKNTVHQFDRVLLVQDSGGQVHVGAPTVEGGYVVARVRGNGKGKKVYAFKFRRRHHKMKYKKGHRQEFTELEILGLGIGPVPAELLTLPPVNDEDGDDAFDGDDGDDDGEEGDDEE